MILRNRSYSSADSGSISEETKEQLLNFLALNKRGLTFDKAVSSVRKIIGFYSDLFDDTKDPGLKNKRNSMWEEDRKQMERIEKAQNDYIEYAHDVIERFEKEDGGK